MGGGGGYMHNTVHVCIPVHGRFRHIKLQILYHMKVFHYTVCQSEIDSILYTRAGARATEGACNLQTIKII